MNEPSIHFRNGIHASTYGKHEEAIRCFTLGHEQGDAECSAMLALSYYEGAGVPRDYREYYQIAQELEAKGSPLSHCLLASAYSDGLGCRGDYEKSLSHLKQWAEISASPIPGISEDCRLHMRAYGLSESLESHMKHEHDANSESMPWIDVNQAVREYAQMTTLADKIMAELSTLAQDKDKQEELLALMERACREGVADAECTMGYFLLQTCDEGDEATWNRGVDLLRRANGTSLVDILLLRMRLEEEEAVRQKLSEQIIDTLRFGQSRMVRADELPIRLDVCRNNWSAVYFVHDVDESIALMDQHRGDRLYRPVTLPIVHITNTDSNPLEKPSMRIVQEGMGGEQTIGSDGDQMPGERFSIDLNKYIVDDGGNIRMELSAADGRYSTFCLPAEFVAHASTITPNVMLFHNTDSLIILPREHDTEKIVLQTMGGEKIAELCNLKQDEPVTVDMWHIKSLMLKERSESFVLLCAGAEPALCFLK